MTVFAMNGRKRQYFDASDWSSSHLKRQARIFLKSLPPNGRRQALLAVNIRLMRYLL
jgi:hypothetical protein